jgi:hypothetical protein
LNENANQTPPVNFYPCSVYPKQDISLNELTALGKQGNLSADEITELEHQIVALDQQILLRSEALLLLKRRGEL